MRGTISSISVAGMLRLLCSYGKTGVLNVDSGRVKGRIEIINGEVTDASAEKTLLQAADKRSTIIQLLLAIEEGSFYFEEKSLPSKKPVGICVEDVILESARIICSDFSGKIPVKDLILPENEVLKTAKFTAGRKISISFLSDEWNLLGSFNGDSNIGAALEESGVEKSKAEIIMYGLVAAGLVRRMRFKIPEVARLAKDELGNIGAAIVDNEFSKQKIDRRKMGMKNFIGLLNGLEISFSEIVGKTKAKEIIEKIWSATK